LNFIFAKLTASEPGGPTNVSIVTNWLEQLRELIPAK